MEPGGCSGAPLEKEGRLPEAAVCSEDPLGHTGRDSSPSWSAFERGGAASQGTKELVGIIKLFHSLAYEHRYLLRVANLVPTFCYVVPCALM